MAKHNQLGKAGEALASSYLQAKGYKILTQNYRFRRAEIDIIAQLDMLLVFIEVKTRGTDKHGFPEEAVSARKIELFLLAAEEFIFQTNWLYDIRFDIISITTASSGTPNIHHIEDAFH